MATNKNASSAKQSSAKSKVGGPKPVHVHRVG